MPALKAVSGSALSISAGNMSLIEAQPEGGFFRADFARDRDQEKKDRNRDKSRWFWNRAGWRRLGHRNGRGFFWIDDAMNSRDQPIRVMMKINPAIEREAVPKREAFELRRQVLRVG